MEHQIYLLLGGNLGNRMRNIQAAIQAISHHIGQVKAVSKVYETAAWGIPNQPAYLNQALQVSSMLPPNELLYAINKIEDDLGRERHERWQARIIDIDILYYSDHVIEGQRLTLPHPHLHHRKFALIPLVDIAPEFVHPILEKNNQELLDLCEDELQVSVYRKAQL
ncbi:MAG: 2-amino-4-hydroxy-6-hydroxymethyldihydropteridine diphosphokinase [Flammeovirgaceae bacterium]